MGRVRCPHPQNAVMNSGTLIEGTSDGFSQQSPAVKNAYRNGPVVAHSASIRAFEAISILFKTR